MQFIPEEVAKDHIAPYLALDDLYLLRHSESWFIDRMASIVKDQEGTHLEIGSLIRKTDDPEIANFYLTYQQSKDIDDVLYWLYQIAISVEDKQWRTLRWLIDRSEPNEALWNIPGKIAVECPELFYLAFGKADNLDDCSDIFLNHYIDMICKRVDRYYRQYSKREEDYNFAIMEFIQLFARSGYFTVDLAQALEITCWHKKIVVDVFLMLHRFGNLTPDIAKHLLTKGVIRQLATYGNLTPDVVDTIVNVGLSKEHFKLVGSVDLPPTIVEHLLVLKFGSNISVLFKELQSRQNLQNLLTIYNV